MVEMLVIVVMTAVMRRIPSAMVMKVGVSLLMLILMFFLVSWLLLLLLTKVPGLRE